VSIHTLSAGTAQITLIETPVRTIALGDGFFIQAGCDKQFATCRAKFGNGVNFRGFPSIPGDDTIVRYPTQGDGSTGQPL
ncbi:MAG: phage BR0599 family protein, partial [Erythrobacter sp.]|nr:phage BR0599 family protein [Erythrobacter sp.]